MNLTFEHLPEGKKLYFASDFHLGAPNQSASLLREKKIVNWLSSIENEAAGIILVGDIFDFWFEYNHVIPKGFTHFLSKIKSLREKGIPIIFFTGNHDLWMFDYFPKEFGIPVLRDPTIFQVNGKLLFVHHGDGLGPGDHFYKFLKKIFTNKLCQWLFKWLHPNIGMGLANYWSSKSRIANNAKDDQFKGDDEWLFVFCKEMEANKHHDYYVFGHRHLPLEIPVGESIYYNLGEWVTDSKYLTFDGQKAKLLTFKG